MEVISPASISDEKFFNILVISGWLYIVTSVKLSIPHWYALEPCVMRLTIWTSSGLMPHQFKNVSKKHNHHFCLQSSPSCCEINLNFLDSHHTKYKVLFQAVLLHKDI